MRTKKQKETTMADKSIFNDLKDALGEAVEHSKGKLELRTTEVPPPPPPRKPRDIIAIRRKINVSQAVFAKGLNVSVRTVQSWEQGQKKPSGVALRLLAIADEKPDIVFSS